MVCACTRRFKFSKMPRPAYHYSELPDSQSIRLGRILDTSLCSKPRVDHRAYLPLTLEQFSLSEIPQYRALSYTWGPPTGHRESYADDDMIPLYIDGQEHSVSPNLFDALLQLGGGVRQ